MSLQEYQERMQEIYRRAYEEDPGLEGFRRVKKSLLTLVMALFGLQKLLALAIKNQAAETKKRPWAHS